MGPFERGGLEEQQLWWQELSRLLAWTCISILHFGGDVEFALAYAVDMLLFLL